MMRSLYEIIYIWTADVDESGEWSWQFIFQFKLLERRSLKKSGLQRASRWMVNIFSKGKRKPYIAYRLSWVESWIVKRIKLKTFIMDSALLKDEQQIFWGLLFKVAEFSFGLSAQSRAIEFLWQKVRIVFSGRRSFWGNFLAFVFYSGRLAF